MSLNPLKKSPKTYSNFNLFYLKFEKTKQFKFSTSALSNKPANLEHPLKNSKILI